MKINTKKNNGLISVIVPIYNVEKYLSKCIESIINQTYKKLEIILVNDGSTDNSLEICEKYRNKDDRIKIINKSNGGLSDARNKGIEIALGDYISFVDSDDYLDYKMIEILYNDIQTYSADISIVNYMKIFEDGTKEDESLDRNDFLVMDSKSAIKNLLDNSSFGNYAWNKLYKRELFEDVKYPFGRKMEDLGTTYKLFFKSNIIVYNPIQLYYYLQRDDSILHNKDLKFILDEYELTIERYKYLKDKYLSFKENDIFLYNYLVHQYALLYQFESIRNEVDLILKRFNFDILKKLNLNEKIKYVMYSINKSLYVNIRNKRIR